MTVAEIMTELEAKGSDTIKKIFLKHGVKEPFFGVKIEYLKVIEKKIKKDYALALELYATHNADAMYLAGLIADDEKMTKENLQTWVQQAESTNINSYTVPWVTAGSRFGFELALQWIDAEEEHLVLAGWNTLNNLVALKPDSELDLPLLKSLLVRIEQNIHTARNFEKYNMNRFIIAIGTYVAPLSQDAMNTAVKVGVVTVDMNGTSCKVPDAATYIKKVTDKGVVGKKKKKVKC